MSLLLLSSCLALSRFALPTGSSSTSTTNLCGTQSNKKRALKRSLQCFVRSWQRSRTPATCTTMSRRRMTKCTVTFWKKCQSTLCRRPNTDATSAFSTRLGFQSTSRSPEASCWACLLACLCVCACVCVCVLLSFFPCRNALFVCLFYDCVALRCVALRCVALGCELKPMSASMLG